MPLSATLRHPLGFGGVECIDVDADPPAHRLNSNIQPTPTAEESLEAWLRLLDSDGQAAHAWLTHDLFRLARERGLIRVSITSYNTLDLADGATKWGVVIAGIAMVLVPSAGLILWSLGQTAGDLLTAWLIPIGAVTVLTRMRRVAPSGWPWIAAVVLGAAVLLVLKGSGASRHESILGFGLAWAVALPWLVDRLSQAAAARTLYVKADHFNRAIAFGKIRIHRR